MLMMTFSPMSTRPSSVAEPICGQDNLASARELDELGVHRRLMLEHIQTRTCDIAEAIKRTRAFSSMTSPRAVLTT